ncbi:phosphoglycolate phosphatase [Acidovorax sp.]|uniref:phosphoglycolate phosphatase n=1 Tax=Acidovorax sp. TaxID=1872122 RepID=UPI00260FD85F|nr:phosphoglycolate phosphatase [Acidovorax sp.]
MSDHATAAPSPLLSRVDAVIVDLDGTMVDTMGDFNEAIKRMLAELALPAICAGHIEHMVGKGSEHLLHSVLNHVLEPMDQAQRAIKIESLYPEVWASYQRHYLAINGQYATVYAGVPEGLAALRAVGLRLACLTNKPTDFALPLLQSKGLDGYFDKVFGGDAFERKKPDPLPLLKTCEALGTVPARTLMVGDSSNDAQAARAAGCPVVLVTYGYNHGQPVRAVDADGFVDSLADVAGLASTTAVAAEAATAAAGRAVHP